MEKDNYEVGQNNRAPKVPRHGPGRGMRPGEKAKNFKGTWAKLLTNCKKYWGAMIFAIICAGIGTVLTLIGPDKLSKMTDLITEGVMTGIDMDGIKRIGITLICFYGCSALLSLVQNLIMGYVTQQVSKGLRSNISRKINRLPMWFYNQTSTGDVLSRVTNDVDTLQMSLNQSLTQLITSVTTLIGVFIMMLSINVWMTLAALLILPVSMFIINKVMKHSQKYFQQQQEFLGNVNGQVEEIYGGHNIVRVFNKEETVTKTFRETNEKLYQSAWKSQFFSGMMMPVMQFVGNIGYVMVALVGGWQVISGAIEVGQIQSFIQYIKSFTQPVQQIAQVTNMLQSTAAASERVFEFLEEKEEEQTVENPVRLQNPEGEVSFEHISFGYDPEQIIIHDFSAEVHQGQKVAIVGPTGAGKTTLVKLLMRFYDVNNGSIKVDGHDVRNFNRGDLRELFGMVLQDTWLFNGTIMENIRYGKLDATDEEVIAAAKAAHADSFIRTLPGGYQMVLNEETSNISQGQKQLLTIARAILADNPILILDEATSSVDTRTEIQIQKAMDNLMKGRTSFVIAHRLSTIRDSDLILVLKDGNIIEQGNHEELMAKKGFYADLYNSQFAKTA